MGVQRIDGPALAALSARTAANTPAPQLRNAEAADTSAPPVRNAPKPNEEQVQQAVRPEKGPAPEVPSSNTRLRVDEASQRIVAQILDENQEVVKQIPPEEMLRIASRLRQIEGLLFDEST